MTTFTDKTMKWAVHPADQGSIKYVEGLFNPSHTLPHANDIITRPFFIDPETNEPIPVRVVEILNASENQDCDLVGIVTRADRNH